MSKFTPQPTILNRKEEDVIEKEQEGERHTTNGHRLSVVSPPILDAIVSLLPPPIVDGDDGTSPATAIPSPPPPHNSLFPILATSMTTTTTTEVTATTLWECQVGEDVSMYGVGGYSGSNFDISLGSMEASAGDSITSTDTGRHHHREREVSSVGSSSGSSTGRSRSGLRLAKKERRQKLKDGEATQAFAGGGGSCDDEDMAEIVVNTPKKPATGEFPTSVRRVSDWALPVLKPTSPPANVDSSATNKHVSVRRGKRDLMRSWLDTPALGALELFHTSDIPNRSPSPSPTKLQCESNNLTPTCVPNLFTPTSHPLLSPTYGTDPSISLSSLQVSIGQPSSMVSMSLECDITATPSESCSTISVRHSRPRETIRSIQAMRASASTISPTMPPPHRTPHVSPQHTALSLPSMAVCIDVAPDSRRSSSSHRPHPSTLRLMSSSGSYSNNLNTVEQQQRDLRGACPRASSGFQLEVTCQSVDFIDMTTATTGLVPAIATASLSLHPGPKPRNVVTFNADAYNLDAWDADVMGLFALPTEGAPVFASRKDTPTAKLGDMSASIDPRRNDSLLSQEASKRDASSLQRTDISASVDAKQLSWSCSRPVVDDCLRSSVSVLSAYFDESRLKPAGTMTQDANPLSDHQDVCTVSSSALSLWNLFSPTEGDMPSFSVSPPLTQYHTSQLLPLTTPATTSNPMLSHTHQAVRRDYLLDISGVHVDSNATSILLKREVNSKEGSGSMFISRSSYNGSNTDPDGCGASSTSFSDIISKFVTLDTLVHQATSYTEQLANPVSGAGHKMRGAKDRWDIYGFNQPHTTTD